jgi:hypothetical protein
VPFYEYFHGDTDAGVGASHQTGWTALVTKMIGELSLKQKAESSTFRAAQSRPAAETA